MLYSYTSSLTVEAALLHAHIIHSSFKVTGRKRLTLCTREGMLAYWWPLHHTEALWSGDSHMKPVQLLQRFPKGVGWCGRAILKPLCHCRL